MRTIIVIVSVLVLTYRLGAQTDIASLDRLNYQYFLGKDYKNLKNNLYKLMLLVAKVIFIPLNMHYVRYY